VEVRPVTLLTLFRRRDPWWQMDGPAARRARLRQRLVAGLALVLSVGAVGGAAVAWAVQLGVAADLWVRLARTIG
jgi:hypothetical protein